MCSNWYIRNVNMLALYQKKEMQKKKKKCRTALYGLLKVQNWTK